MAERLNGTCSWLRLFSHAAIPLLAAFALTTILSGAVEQKAATNAERELVRLTNQDRAKQGVNALAENDLLTQAAREHMAMMLRERKLSHRFAGEPGVAERIAATGLRFQSSGENVAVSSDTHNDKQNAMQINDLLMHSPPHRENILKPDYNAVGIAMASDGQNVWVVEDFARAFAATSPEQVEKQVETAIEAAREQQALGPMRFQREPALRDYACLSNVTPSRLLRAFPQAHSADVYTGWDAGELTPAVQKRITSPDTHSIAVAACELMDAQSHGSYRIVTLFY